MKRALLVLLACACGKSADAPHLSPVAEITEEATLVAGTRRVAIYGGETWWQSDAGGLPLDIARELRGREIAEVFLGVDPIVVVGEEHAETIARFTPGRVPIDFDGHPTKIVTAGNREAWLAKVGIHDKLVFVTGTRVEPAPELALVGPPADALSPVSKRLCATPKVEDIVAFRDEVHALVSECNDAAPLRIASDPSGRVQTLPSRDRLAMTFIKLAVSPDGKLHLVGIHDGHVYVANVTGDMIPHGSRNVAATRVETALYADDGALWTLVLDADARRHVLRNGIVLRTASPPKALALDAKLGVVVLADKVLLAERPGARIVIETHR